MTTNKTLLFSVPLCVLFSLGVYALGGCDRTRTEEWYMGHHEELIRMYADCLDTQTFGSGRCIPVMNAVHRSMDQPDVVAGIQKVNDEFMQRRLSGDGAHG